MQRKQVFSAIHHDYSGSLHTFCNCKKYIESTVGTRTHVKPVFFTLNVFAVYLHGHFLCSCLWMPPNMNDGRSQSKEKCFIKLTNMCGKKLTMG